MPRAYHPDNKHKWPKGYGSLCPAKMPKAEPARLLESALAVPGVGANKLWIAAGRWCFCAHPSPGEGENAWHGFPVIGGEVDERIWAALLAAGLVSRRDVKRLRSQRELPDLWP